MSTKACIAAALVILLLARASYRRLASPHPKSHLPFDLLGFIFPIQVLLNFRRHTLLYYIQKQLERYNGTFAVNVFGQVYLVTDNHYNIQHILKGQFDSYSAAEDRVHLFQSLSTKGILTLDGEPWRASREQLRRQFSQQKAIVDLEMHERHFMSFLDSLRPADGQTVNLKDYFVRLVQDSHSEFVWGASMGTLAPDKSPELQDLSQSFLYVADTMARKGFAGPFHWVVGGKTFVRACSIINRYVERRIAPDMTSSTTSLTGSCFLHRLAKTEDSIISLRDQVTNTFLAGADSMVSTLNSTLWLLARDERVYQKLRQEVLRTCYQDLPTYEQIKRLKYLRHVLSEGKHRLSLHTWP